LFSFTAVIVDYYRRNRLIFAILHIIGLYIYITANSALEFFGLVFVGVPTFKP
jgi:hypothetical protein